MSTGTALATRDPQKAQLVAGGDVAAIIPRTVEEIFRLAGALQASGMAPSTLNSAEKITVAIMAGAELGLPPFQALQSFAVINGRPTIWGDGLMAVVRSNGFKVREWLEGDEGEWTARCELTRPDTGEIIPGEFSVADAKRAGLWGKQGPWQQHPKRMLKMRARAFALRDGAADVLRGFQMREEVEDYQPIREVREPAKSGVMARLAAAGHHQDTGFSEAHVDQEIDGPRAPAEVDAVIEAEQVTDAEFHEQQGAPARTEDGFPGDCPQPSGYAVAADDDDDPETWGREEMARIEAAESTAQLDALAAADGAQDNFRRLEKHSPSLAKELSAMARGKRKALADKERQQ